MPGAEGEGRPVRSDGRTVSMSSVVDMGGAQESRPDCVEAPARRVGRRAAGPDAESARAAYARPNPDDMGLLRGVQRQPFLPRRSRSSRVFARASCCRLPLTRRAGWAECNIQSG
jgi:hypothetical protein